MPIIALHDCISGQLTPTLLLTFQNEYFGSYASHADTGYYFVPQECSKATSECLLHVYFHGCANSATQVGTEFIELTGLLEMADANNIVLLLPQVGNFLSF